MTRGRRYVRGNRGLECQSRGVYEGSTGSKVVGKFVVQHLVPHRLGGSQRHFFVTFVPPKLLAFTNRVLRPPTFLP